MLTVLYLAAAAIGAAAAQIGDEPLWPLAIAGLLAFPFAAAAADRARAPRSAPLPALLAALTGGLLVGLAVRLALLAPGWESVGTVDCGGPSLEDQQLVLWASAVLFALSSVPVLAALASIGLNLRSGSGEERLRVPVAFYPLGVAAAGLALVGASLVTSC